MRKVLFSFRLVVPIKTELTFQNMDFSIYTVPGSILTAITVYMLISILLPIVLMIIWRVKTKAKISTFFIGAATFVVFAMILESVQHNIVLKIMGQEAFMKMPFYAIYGGLAAGIYEEVGRYIVMRLFMKKSLYKKEGIMFGIGHGGIESILIIGFTYVSNLMIAFLLNAGQGNLLIRGMNSDMQMQLLTKLAPLWNGPASAFWLAGVERIFAITFHICASYLVYRAVKDKKISLLFLAIFLHAAMDGVMVTILKTLNNTFITEGFIALFSIVFAVITIKCYRSEISEEPEEIPAPVLTDVQDIPKSIE